MRIIWKGNLVRRSDTVGRSDTDKVGDALIGRLWYRLVRLVCGVAFGLLFRFRVDGTDNMPPAGPVLVLSNHQSHLDPVLIGVASPRQLRFLARQTLFFWPLGCLIESLGAIPIDRDAGVAGLRATLRVLRDGQALVLFPEGTRTADGRLQPLQAGFLPVSRRSGATLLPVGIAGAFDALPRGRKIPRFVPIAVKFGQLLPPDELENLSNEQLRAVVSDRLAEATAAAQALI